jgi:hypothetical protein
MPLISVCLFSEEIGLEKPNPAIFRLALSHAGCAPKEAVTIGDRLDNDIPPSVAGLEDDAHAPVVCAISVAAKRVRQARRNRCRVAASVCRPCFCRHLRSHSSHKHGQQLADKAGAQRRQRLTGLQAAS